MSAGYAYLRTGDARLSNHHPPLIDIWTALPLLTLDLNLPLDSMAWQNGERGSFGDVFVWQANSDQALLMIWLGRLPNVALAVLLGAAIWSWTSKLSNKAAGLLALALYALDPGIIANAGLSTNDLGVAAMLFFATWAWWRWLERPLPGRLILAGVLAGAACTSKYSGLVIGPIMLLLALARRPIDCCRAGVWLRRAGGLAGAGVVCVFTIWTVYGFSTANGLPAPTFWEGILFQSDRIAHGQPVYAMGKVWPNGVWFYYPLAFFLKTPIPTLTLTAAGTIISIKRRAFRVIYPLAIPLIVVSGFTLISALQLGHRYLLPILPFIFGLAGQAVTQISWPPWRGRNAASTAIVGLLLIWLMMGTAVISPHYLSYFNEFAGGPDNADRFLVDSNLDWGQDLPALRTLIEGKGLPYVHLGYFGTAVPGAYGVSYWPAPGFLRFIGNRESMAFNPYSPTPGWYAISRTSLRQGMVLTHPDLYAYFQPLTPEARAGYSINLYHVDYPSSTPVVRAVVQGPRIADVPAEQLGWEEGQRLIAKWTPDGDSFVFAMNGAARYLTPEPLAYAPDLQDAFLQNAQRGEGGAFEFDAQDTVAPLLARWTAESPLWAPEGTPMEAPVAFDGRIKLLGYRLAQDSASPGGEISLVVAWKIAGDLKPPIASFVHLIDETGHPIAQYDGWGSAIRGLEVGDVIVQHVRLSVPPGTEAGAYRLQLGIYSRDTMARWPVHLSDGASIDRVLLPEVNVH